MSFKWHRTYDPTTGLTRVETDVMGRPAQVWWESPERRDSLRRCRVPWWRMATVGDLVVLGIVVTLSVGTLGYIAFGEWLR